MKTRTMADEFLETKSDLLEAIEALEKKEKPFSASTTSKREKRY